MVIEIVAPKLGGDSHRPLVERELGKLTKYFHNVDEEGVFARVALRPHPKNDAWVRATVDLSLPGAPKIIADAEGESVREALKRSADEAERQLREFKTRREML